MPNSSKREKIEIHEGSGNVFADLGFKNPDLMLAKAVIVQRIRRTIQTSKLTQTRAAELLGIDQPKISNLLKGQTSGYSLERLLKFLNKLGQRVEIRIRTSKATTDQTEPQVVVV